MSSQPARHPWRMTRRAVASAAAKRRDRKQVAEDGILVAAELGEPLCWECSHEQRVHVEHPISGNAACSIEGCDCLDFTNEPPEAA